MPTLAELWDEPVAKTTGGQGDREQTRTAILQNELLDAQKRLSSAIDPQAKMRFQADVDALNRELGFGKKVKSTQVTQQPQTTQPKTTQPLQSGNFADLWDATESPSTTDVTQTSTANAGRGSYEGYNPLDEVSGKVVGKKLTPQNLIQPQTVVGQALKQVFDARKAVQQLVRPAYEIGGTLIGAPIGAVAGPTAGIIETIQSGKLGTPEGIRLGAQKAEEVQQGLTPDITTPTAQNVLSGLQKAFEASKLPPAITPELAALQPTIGSATKQITQGIKARLPEVTFERVPTSTEIGAVSAKPAVAKPTASSVGAAGTELNPYTGQLTGEETARGQFPQIKLSKTPTDVSPNEQALRAQIVQQVMPDSVRPGVITGNENILRDEHTKAKLDTPEGLIYKQQIANEQNALSRFAQDRVDATGASPTLINDEQRGNRINDIFFGTAPDDIGSASLKGYLNQTKQEIYKDAFNKMGNNPITTSHIDNLFADPQTQATFKAEGTSDILNGAKDLIQLAKTTGFRLPDNTVAPAGSVAAYDAVRKSLNGIWSPAKARAISEINRMIDKDIAANADPALYKLGDKVHQIEKNILEAPGIENLFGEVDQNGITRSKTPAEKIPTKLNNLRLDQWRNIRDTLDSLANGTIRNAPEGLPPVPDELRQSAAAARAEIDGALAREIQKAGATKTGVWNQNSVNNVLNSVIGQKILETFPPEEIKNFHVLNYAGHLMPGIHPYEGAGLQQRRLGIIEGNLPKAGMTAGATAGGFIAGPTGAAVGGYIGGKAGEKGQAALASRTAKIEAEKAQKALKESAQKSTKLSNVGKK